jgi:hypothetical protein
MPQSRVSALSLLTLCTAMSILSCGQAATEREGPGAVGLALQVSPGNTLSSATYTISGPNGYASAGTVAVGDSPDVPVVVQHLPNGIGYELQVSGSASDGVTLCEGSATFDVTNDATSTVLVHLTCGVPSGDVQITGTFNICPMLDGLSANPNAIRVGGTASLTTTAHDSDNGPAQLSYRWSANGAVLKTTGPNLVLACSSPGDIAIQVALSDGDSSPGCADQLSVSIHCNLP